MTKQELAVLLTQINPEPMVNINELPEGFEGTLVYGYTCDRHTFHVYAKDGEIHALTYNHEGEMITHSSGKEIYGGYCIPNKRIYRQESQFFFLSILAQKGFNSSVVDSNDTEDYNLPVGEFLERALLAENVKIIPSLA